MTQTLTTKICNRILMLLGFSTTALSQVACMYGPRQSDYGALTMDFEVSGKVVDKESAPIAGIKNLF